MADGAAAGDDLDVKLAETQQEVQVLVSLDAPGGFGGLSMEDLAEVDPNARDDQVEMDMWALKGAFDLFDADGDGKLTEGEVIAALTRKTAQGTEFSEEDARATWRRWQAEFDLNNDGKISVEELARWKRAPFRPDRWNRDNENDAGDWVN